MLDWFQSYISDRSLSVKLQFNYSYSFTASSGVPQGSRLGPILFILFISDIADIFDNVNFQIFADDLKVYKVTTCSKDIEILHISLGELYSWTKLNRLNLNISKCKSMTFSRCTSPIAVEYCFDINP